MKSLDGDQAQRRSTLSFLKACRTQLFTYHELEEATRGFEGGQKLVDCSNGAVYAGVLGDGSHVAVHKVQCGNERDLIQVYHATYLAEDVARYIQSNMVKNS